MDSGLASDESLKRISLEIEENMGTEFLHEIMNQVTEYVNTSRIELEKNKTLLSLTKFSARNFEEASKTMRQSKFSNQTVTHGKGNLVAFMWGALLSTYLKKLEETDIKVALLHPIYQQYRTDSRGAQRFFKEELFKKNEKFHYFGILERLLAQSRIEQIEYKLMSKKLKRLFESEVYSMFREEDVLTYCPRFIQTENLRIFRKEQKLLMEEKYKQVFGTTNMADIGAEIHKTNANFHKGENFDFALQNTPSDIFGKYRIFVALEYLLKEDFKLYLEQNGFSDQSQEANVFSSLLQGFSCNYKMNQRDQQVLK